MAAEDPPTLRGPWPEVISPLVAAGWARVPRAVDPAPAARLGEDDGRVWRLAGDEGVVRPSDLRGVVAAFTLSGYAAFRVWDANGEVTGWATDPGRLTILRGAGWPSPESRCPLHEVDPPAGGERTIMTFRHNGSGAGAGYCV